METVHMQSPDGETLEVEATEKVLVPLMVQGWKQVQPGETVEFPGAAQLEPAGAGDPVIEGEGK